MSRVLIKNLLVFLTLCIVTTPVWALDAKPDSSIFDPATDSGRYMSVHDAETLLQRRWSMGFYLDYARKPISLLFTTVGVGGAATQRFDVVRDQLNGTLVGAFGITDWVTAGVSVPTTFWQVFFDPSVRLTGTPPQETKAGIGDIRLETKFRLLDIEEYGIGVAVVPHMIFPTGRKGSFISGERWTPGVKLAVEGAFNDRFFAGLNVGYQFVKGRTQYFAGSVDSIIDDLLTVGIGARYKINDQWAVLAEGLAETVVTNRPFAAQVRTPMEVLAGAQWTPQNRKVRGLGITMMAGSGVTRGVGAPQLHAVLGVTYPTPKVVTAEPLQAVVEEKIIITQKVHFAYDKSTIREISFPILDDVAKLLTDNPSLANVRVEGHTDSHGSDQYNQSLSQRRAESVVEYLVKAGIDRNRLTPVGYGESRPVADNETDEGRARNRRTEFTITSGS